ncbi:MAG: DUF805 domain-containing protein [Pseudomonadota bacterium]
MTFTDAIRTCFRKYVTFSGRASRPEFWWFFPLGVAIPLFGIGVAAVKDASFLVCLMIGGVLIMPLFAVGVRRLQDTGAYGWDAVKPWGFAFCGLVAADISVRLYSTITLAFASPTPPDGPGGLGFVVIYGSAMCVAVAAAFLLFVIFLSSVTNAVGQCLCPSEPGPNRYGPNPHEVTP